MGTCHYFAFFFKVTLSILKSIIQVIIIVIRLLCLSLHCWFVGRLYSNQGIGPLAQNVSKDVCSTGEDNLQKTLHS